ncbi:MAG: gamma-glutamyltransferase, partial [Gammaproteobacteria bacterium]|nr:gamma-glutamyltransferase [Gammaproteobacteria bacterium]
EEGALKPEEILELEDLGHKLQQSRWRYGNMQGIMWDKKSNIVSAASDPRGIGSAETRIQNR